MIEANAKATYIRRTEFLQSVPRRGEWVPGSVGASRKYLVLYGTEETGAEKNGLHLERLRVPETAPTATKPCRPQIFPDRN